MSDPVSVRETPNPEGLNQWLAEVEEIPTIPETLIQILQILDDPDGSVRQLADLIQQDPPLMSKILRLANSPYYAGTGDLISIKDCVGVLGFRTIRQVALCVSIATTLVAACAQRRVRLDYRELWKHSVLTAAIAKELARIDRRPNPEEMFIAGLLHDLGKFVLILCAAETYDRVIDERAQVQCPLVDIEQRVFGFDHCHAGAAFADAWRFPKTLAASCLRHHDQPRPTDESDRSDHSDQAATVALVALADYLANTMAPPPSDLGASIDCQDAKHLYEAAGISPATVEENAERLQEIIENSTHFLDLA